MPPSKYYVVWKGLDTGVFGTWGETLKLVDKVPGAKYKSFPTKAEAEKAFKVGPTKKIPTSRSKKSSKPKVDLPVCDVIIYCDGACEPNPGASGSGIAIYRNSTLAELHYGLFNPHGTNNTAELNALHQALLIAQIEIKKGVSVAILSDSMYSINCISQWAGSWKRQGWKKKNGDEIKNLELIQVLHDLYNKIRQQLILQHVKAHVGTEGNELADRMSIVAVERKELVFVRYSDPIDIPALLKMRAG